MKNTGYGLLALLLTACLSLMMLGGCGGTATPNATTSTVSTAATTTTAVKTTASTTTAAATTATSPAGELYHNDTFGFSLMLPASWAGRYTVIESSSVRFFVKSIRDAYDAGTGAVDGKLFSLQFIPSAEYRDDMFPAYVKLGEKDSLVAVWLDVTDVRFDDKDSAGMTEYLAMYEDLPAVQTSFSYL